jgi:ATP-dependent Clp protease ATP-binding subunit ClpC
MDRFDDAARRVLALAREEAHALNHNYLGTEHLLLGLLREDQGIAAEALRRLWIDLDKVRAAVVSVIERGDRPVPVEQIDYVPRVRKVLALTVDEARALEYDHVGPEHLLLGLVREGEGIAAGILESLGALRQAREVTLALMAQARAARPVEGEQQAG